MKNEALRWVAYTLAFLSIFPNAIQGVYWMLVAIFFLLLSFIK